MVAEEVGEVGGGSRRCSCLRASQVQKPLNPQQPSSSQTMCQAARGGGAAAAASAASAAGLPGASNPAAHVRLALTHRH